VDLVVGVDHALQVVVDIMEAELVAKVRREEAVEAHRIDWRLELWHLFQHGVTRERMVVQELQIREQQVGNLQ
jgi:hypothetical protein